MKRWLVKMGHYEFVVDADDDQVSAAVDRRCDELGIERRGASFRCLDDVGTRDQAEARR